jgi:hypothetical protein
MGTVYEAHDLSLDRGVALKVLHPAIAGDPEVVDRFVREARAAARVNHQNLAHIYHVGSEGDPPFYAMELVAGRNLEEEVAASGPLPLAAAVDVLVQAARGLAAAHAVGVVHRDVKPSNLLRVLDGTVKVTDFGLAKSLGDPSATHAGTLLGTPTYMSPEQCRGASVDARGDVYSLGLTGWFLLAGEPPFRGPGLGEVLSDQMHRPLPPLAPRRPDLPPGVDEALGALCAKDPSARPATMTEVASLLESLRPRRLKQAPLAARAAAIAFDLAPFVVLFALVTVALGMFARFGMDRDLVEALLGFGAAAYLTATQLLPELSGRVSLGKRLLDLAVVAEDGTRPGRGATVARFFLRWPAAPLFLFWEDFTPFDDATAAVRFWTQVGAWVAGAICYRVARRRTVSDLLTRTRVVYATP